MSPSKDGLNCWSIYGCADSREVVNKGDLGKGPGSLDKKPVRCLN